jgi:hypothetical protein
MVLPLVPAVEHQLRGLPLPAGLPKLVREPAQVSSGYAGDGTVDIIMWLA